MISIRTGISTDAPDIARIHVESWSTTYAGIMPKEAIAAQSYDQRHSFWSRILSERRETMVLVADRDGEVVGFSSAGASRTEHSRFSAEIYAIYLLPKDQGQGHGKKLFNATKDALAGAGHRGMVLWVLARNPACGCYVRMGGVPVAEKVEEFAGENLTEVAYGWTEIGGDAPSRTSPG